MSKIKYKHIKLKMSHKVFRDAQKSLITRSMADNTSGITDAILIKIIKHISGKEKKVQIEYKKEREK